METNLKLREAVEWYINTRPLYEMLAKKVELILREILDANKINYYSISSRAKAVERYKEKASKEKYSNPRDEIMDMAGIRVITYTDSDAKNVFKLIQDSLEIFPEHTIDKTDELGTDRVGYRSIHCIGALGKERLTLPENRMFKGMCFEVQVRTILQHAWAEFEHERNYKFSGVLPKDLRRRLSIVAGNLELIDKEFDEISKAIDTYVVEVGEKTKIGDLSIPINSKSLGAYATKRFEPLLQLGVKPRLDLLDKDLIEDLSTQKLHTLQDLENIIPKGFIEKSSRSIHGDSTLRGVIFDLMIINNADKICEVYKERGIAGFILDEKALQLYKEYGVDLRRIALKHNISITTKKL